MFRDDLFTIPFSNGETVDIGAESIDAVFSEYRSVFPAVTKNIVHMGVRTLSLSFSWGSFVL